MDKFTPDRTWRRSRDTGGFRGLQGLARVSVKRPLRLPEKQVHWG